MNVPRTIPVDRQIAELRTRLAIAKSERDAWQAVGREENYLAACAMVDALVLRLDRLEETTRFPAVPSDGRGRQTAPLCITYNGRSYGYRGYRYDRFAEAVDYARLDRSRAFADPGAHDAAPLERLPAPSEAELDLMRTLGISFADGVFHWREYRYDRLADALAYARRAKSS